MSTHNATLTNRPPSPFSVYRNKNFSLLWTSQLISTMGSALTSLAASIYVYRLTGSAASVGLMLIATAAPSLIVGLIAGVFVDRYDRKKIMVISNVIRAILVFSIPFLVANNIAWLYIIVALSASIGQFFDPALESIMPEVASEEELAAANSMMAISSFGSTAIGFAASGLIASQADIRWAFYLDALSFLVSTLLIFFVRVKPIPTEGTVGVRLVFRNVQSGLRFLYDTPILRSLFLVSIPVLISFGLTNALLLPFADQALGATEFEYGIQEGLTSLGFVFGSLLMAGIFDRLREGPWIAFSYLGMGLVGIAYSQVFSIPIAIILATFSGFLNSPSVIGRRLIIQRNTPREMRGRVNSAFFVSRDILFILGMALAGLADVIDVRLLYLLSSLMVVLAGVWVFFLPGLRQERAEWRRAISLLRAAPAAPGLGVGRPAALADFDLLVGVLPTFSSLTEKERESLVYSAMVVDAPAGTAIIREGDTGDLAYFILEGKTVISKLTASGEIFSLSTMLAGDFFGEIAALTGTLRTASVVADENCKLLQVPAQTLRGLMGNPAISQLFLSKMTERLARTSLTDLPRFAGYDQQTLKDLRTAPAEG